MEEQDPIVDRALAFDALAGLLRARLEGKFNTSSMMDKVIELAKRDQAKNNKRDP